MQEQIETALLSGQKIVHIGNIEIQLRKWELKRDTSRNKRIQATKNAQEIIKIIQS